MINKRFSINENTINIQYFEKQKENRSEYVSHIATKISHSELCKHKHWNLRLIEDNKREKIYDLVIDKIKHDIKSKNYRK